MFIYGEDQNLQQEIIKVMFKYMNIRRELLHHFQKTIVMFRSSIAQKVDDINKILRKSKILIQDSTVNIQILIKYRFGKCHRTNQKNRSNKMVASHHLVYTLWTLISNLLTFIS